MWDPFKWKGVVPAPGMVFNCAHISFDFGHVLILRAEVEADFTKNLIKRGKFRIGIHTHDLKSPTVVNLQHSFESS